MMITAQVWTSTVTLVIKLVFYAPKQSNKPVPVDISHRPFSNYFISKPLMIKIKMDNFPCLEIIPMDLSLVPSLEIDSSFHSFKYTNIKQLSPIWKLLLSDNQFPINSNTQLKIATVCTIWKSYCSYYMSCHRIYCEYLLKFIHLL